MKQEDVTAGTGATDSPTKAMAKRIRVLIAGEDRFSSELLKSALLRHRQFEIACSDMSAEQVSATVAAFDPEIVLLNCDLQDGAGLKNLRRIVGLVQSSRVIALSDGCDQSGVIELFRAGAKGVFHRSQPLSQLARCIQAVNQGQVWATSADLGLVLHAFASSAPLQCVNGNGETLLSPREQQVVELLAEGLSNHEIAEQLRISEHTVKNHLFRIYERLGISTRVELILYAITKRSVA